MKKIIPLLISAAMAVSFTGCSKVPAGNVGVKVHLLGTSKGVDSEILGPGRYFIGINEELYLFPTFQQNHSWVKANNESIIFQTKEGLTIDADIGITYSIDPTKVSLLFQKYRRGLTEVTDIFLRNLVRDAISRHASVMTVESAYGEGKTDLLKKAEQDIRQKVQEDGLIIENIYLIGSFRLPDSVVTALDRKIAATQITQQRQNEIAQAKAEADKEVETARGQATANEIKAKSITPELIQYEQILLQQKWIEKWDGKQPSTVLGNQSALISIPTK